MKRWKITFECTYRFTIKREVETAIIKGLTQDLAIAEWWHTNGLWFTGRIGDMDMSTGSPPTGIVILSIEELIYDAPND